MEYKNNIIADSVNSLNENYFLKQKTNQKYIGLSYLFKRDLRDIKAYPLHGHYYDFEIVKKGVGLIKDDVDMLFITASYKKYWQLYDRIYFASLLRGKLSNQLKQPYFNERGLGYGQDYIRAYEYYVIDGQNFALLKTNFKYELLRPHIIKTNVIPLEKFNTIPYAYYINLFGDMAYVQDKQYYQNNSLANTFLFGAGVGIDYVSYYNIVMRIEYSMIMSNNKFGERDIFLHFHIPV